MVRKSKKELNIIGSMNDDDNLRIEPGLQGGNKGYYDYEPGRRDRNLDYDEYEREYDSYDSGYDDYDLEQDSYDYDDYEKGYDDYEDRLINEEESRKNPKRKDAAGKNRSRARKNSYRDDYDESFEDDIKKERKDNFGRKGTQRKKGSYKDDKHYYKRSLEEHSYGGSKSRLNKNKSKKNKKMIILRNVGIIVAAVIVALFCVWKFVPSVKHAAVKTALKSGAGASVASAVIGDDYNNNVFDKDFDKSKIVINNGVTAPEGYTTVALFGLDARDGSLTTAGSRSDSMMVVSVEEATDEIKMASIYRDTFLLDSLNENGEYYIGKANAAYAFEGPLGAVNMLNRNWDLAVTDYVVVNFGGLAAIIDELGGLTLTISDEEVEEINYRMDEQIQVFGGEYVKVEQSGTVKLNGAQATAFCRIRAVDFTSPVDGQVYSNDFGRTARQRYALTEIMKQFKNLGLSKLVDVGNKLCAGNVGEKKFIATSLSLSELMEFLGKVVDMNITGQEAFPTADHMHGAMLECGDSIVADTLEENATLLHKFLYNETNYTPSSDLYTYAAMISSAEAAQSGNDYSDTYDENGDTDWSTVEYQQWEETTNDDSAAEAPEQTEPPEQTEETWENEPTEDTGGTDEETYDDTGTEEP